LERKREEEEETMRLPIPPMSRSPLSCPSYKKREEKKKKKGRKRKEKKGARPLTSPCTLGLVAYFKKRGKRVS